jgi:capsular exopolysaccharide synthesis family protein
MLRTNLALDSRTGHVLLVCSPAENEGKTTVATNLAFSVALQGRKVLLIDGDLRNPGVAPAFGLQETLGLTDVMEIPTNLWDMVKRIEGVDIIPAGKASAKSAEILSSSSMKSILEKARKNYDVTIIDSTPILGGADTLILARQADEVVMVVRANASKMNQIKESKKLLDSTGSKIAGFVFTMAKLKECRYIGHFSELSVRNGLRFTSETKGAVPLDTLRSKSN